MVLDLKALIDVLKIVTESCVTKNVGLKEARFGFVPETEHFARLYDDRGGLTVGLQEKSTLPIVCFCSKSLSVGIRTNALYADKRQEQNSDIYAAILEENREMSRPMVGIYEEYHKRKVSPFDADYENDSSKSDCVRKEKNGVPTVTVYGRLYSARSHESVLEAGFMAFVEGEDSESFVKTMIALVELFCTYNEMRFECRLR